MVHYCPKMNEIVRLTLKFFPVSLGGWPLIFLVATHFLYYFFTPVSLSPTSMSTFTTASLLHLHSFVNVHAPRLGTSIVKWTKQVLRYTKAVIFLVKGLYRMRKMLFKIDYFSWWPLLLSQALKYRIPIWVLQNLSSKVMHKSNIILNVSFMTLNILSLIFFHIPCIHYNLEVIVIF